MVFASYVWHKSKSKILKKNIEKGQIVFTINFVLRVEHKVVYFSQKLPSMVVVLW